MPHKTKTHIFPDKKLKVEKTTTEQDVKDWIATRTFCGRERGGFTSVNETVSIVSRWDYCKTCLAIRKRRRSCPVTT